MSPEHPLNRPLFAERRAWFGDTVLIVFLAAQVLDGAFTYMGVHLLGVAEGNPLIAFYMQQLGVGPSLTLAKILAAGCAVVLHVLGFHRVLAVLTLLYLSFAILPWSFVFFTSH